MTAPQKNPQHLKKAVLSMSDGNQAMYMAMTCIMWC